jgi:hypothetical protein
MDDDRATVLGAVRAALRQAGSPSEYSSALMHPISLQFGLAKPCCGNHSERYRESRAQRAPNPPRPWGEGRGEANGNGGRDLHSPRAALTPWPSAPWLSCEIYRRVYRPVGCGSAGPSAPGRAPPSQRGGIEGVS